MSSTSQEAVKEPPQSPDALVEVPPVDEAKLLRKIDLHVLPMLFLVYFVAFLDRVNISNALTMSMPKELGLTGQQPNVALTVFFVPYVLFEIPSNIAMKRFNPHIWLSASITAFGLVMLCQGFVKNYSGLIATRFFLGLAEAGVFPGSFYLISFWYKHEEAQRRFTFYWSSVIIAGAFGGLLATAIANMDGIRGLSNWRWIFILEGLLTIVVGIISFWGLADFPREAKWLTEEERKFVVAKTRTDESHKVSVTFQDVVNYFKDPKNYVVAVMYFSIVVPVYALAYFLPTIVQTLHYSVVQTQLHSVPPFAAALGLCLVMAYLSDKTRVRLPYILFGDALMIVGLAILISVHGREHFSTEYAGICLVTMGSLGAGASVVCWYLMNLKGHVERSIGSAWMIGFGNTGGIVATFAFLKKDAPYYRTGYWILIGISIAGVVSALLYAALVQKERREAARKGDEKAHMLSL